MRRALSYVLVLGLGITGCAKNPVTGKNQFVMMSENQEIQLGQQAKQEVAQSIGVYEFPKAQSYVSNIGMKLAKTSERPELPWSFQVVDDASVNAFALPGGPIFVTRGILAHMNSEAELASVIGHEIGHVTARHSVAQVSKAQLAQLGVGIGTILAGPKFEALGQLAGAGMQLFLLKHGRDAEKEADELGFKYSIQHRYDVREMGDMFTTLTRVSKAAGAEGKLPEWLSTHPDPENRVTANQRRIQELKNVNLDQFTVGVDTHMAAIDGMVYGQNPRHGFFRGALFLHPDLKFQIAFPGGWKTQNTPTVVGAGSPQQDAIFALAPGGKESPEATMRKFLAQEGIQPGQVRTTPINGNPAATATFAAQTEQGAVEGLVTFLSFGGNTYQLLGYTKQGGLQKYGPTFEAATNSFAALTDQTALNVQPAKLQIVKAPRDMTIEQFHAEFPSTIPVSEIALINGLAAGGRVKTGQAVKRVTGGVPPQS